MRELGSGPVAMGRSLWRQRELVGQLARREIVGRYRGSFAGLAWSLFNPLLMLAVYTFVFSVAFHARWPVPAGGSDVHFSLVLFAGMIVHALFADCANRAPRLVLENVNFVKKVIFPLEILAVVCVVAALFHMVVSLLVLVAALVLSGASPGWPALALPLVLLPLVAGTLGVTWILSSLGVYVRDAAPIVTIITTVLLFLSPVFYPISALPEAYRPWLMLNPISFEVNQARAVLLFGQWPDWGGLAAYGLAGLALAWLGFWWFQKTRRGFADVL